MRKGRTAVICFTKRGWETALRIREILTGSEEKNDPARPDEHEITIWCGKKDFLPDADTRGAVRLAGSLKTWTKERFADSSLLIFVGAAGIAVRSIAPFLVSKKLDPAVLCVDEAASYVIPLVSGHIGGANEQTALLAGGLGAIPVITTATDINGKFAVDVFAEKNGLHIADMSLAKAVSASLLDQAEVSVSCEGVITGTVPEELRLCEPEEGGGLHIHIGVYALPDPKMPASFSADAADGKGVLYLIPKAVTIGVGCRRGKDPGQLRAFVDSVLLEEGIFPEAVERIATIDIKKDEKAVKDLAEAMQVPLAVFSAEELKRCEGVFASSAFVSETVGVDNVCERSACLGSGGGRLLKRKTARDGMTLALAVKDWGICFE